MKHLTPLIEPVVHSTISVHQTPGQMGYGRVDNPTRLALERELAVMEGMRFALAFSSGSAALAAVFSLLKMGDTVLRHDQSYEGTIRMLKDIFSRFGICNTSIDFSDVKKIGMHSDNAQMMFCETVTNPCLTKLDIEEIARQRNKKAIFVVDNTMTPLSRERPLVLGADIVVSSLTKYISGHHDVIGGTIMTNDPRLFKRLQHIQWTLGAILSPQDCFFVLRGMQTLKIRVLAHRENAHVVSEFLKKHSRVAKVVFPGESGMVSFWLKENGKKTILFLTRLNHIRIAHSFGGTQTTILHPRSMMNFSLSHEELERQQISDSLCRLSVGIEDVLLINKDLEQALST